MPTKPTDIDELAITLSGDGTATLTGINYNDLRALLTAASLHRYDNPPKVEALDGTLDDVRHENNLEAFHWHLQEGLIIDVLSAMMSKAISPTYGNGSISNIRSLHAHSVAELEQTVRRAEAEAAAQPAPKPDLVAEAAAEIAKAIRAADVALTKLKQARG